MPFGLWAWTGPRNHKLDGVQIPHERGQFWKFFGERGVHCAGTGTFCRELYKNCWTNRFAVWFVESGRPKEAQVQSYSPGGAKVALMFPHMRAHWRHLTNTTEPSIRCGDVALCQITLTTGFYSLQLSYAHRLFSFIQTGPKSVTCVCF